MGQRTCNEEGCEETKILARGLCSRHYHNHYNTGTLPPRQPRPQREPQTCDFKGCPQLRVARGFCPKHYWRFMKTGDPSLGGRLETCTIEGCPRPHCARGWCRPHYEVWKAHGDPLYVRVRPTEAERFWSKVDKDGPLPERRPELGPCWVWTAGLNNAGYGKFSVNGKTVAAHRWSYTEVSPIPEGLEIDHLCRNRACVRWDHLEAVTPQVNVLRGDTVVAANAAKMKCPAGHDYDLINTRYSKNGGRYCLQCKRDKHAAAAERKRLAKEENAA